MGNGVDFKAMAIALRSQLIACETAKADLVEVIEICLKAEYERRKKLLPGAPATTYTQARIDKIESVLAKVRGV